MSFENVQLWFAKDKNESIITINKVDKSTQEKYYCPLCGSEVVPRQGEINSWCFAHIDKSNCSSESMFHFWYKNKLIEPGDKFKIKSDIEREYICKEILIEQTYEIKGKQYNPDLTIITECGKTIYFEMEYSNKKKLEDYLDIWNGLGNIVVEVDTKTLINSNNEELLTFKALWYEGKCFNVRKGEDSVYHDTIGKYKEQYYNKNRDDEIKKDIENLDWLWKDIRKYKMGEIDIEHISSLIKVIEKECSKKIIVEILRKSSCNQIIKDYIEFNRKNNLKFLEYIIEHVASNEFITDIKYNFTMPRLIYDRLFGSIGCYSMLYKGNNLIGLSCNVNKESLSKFVEIAVDKMEAQIKEKENDRICDLLNSNKVLEYVFKYLKNKYDDLIVFDKKYDNRFTRCPIIEIGKIDSEVCDIDLSNNEVLLSCDRKYLRNYIKKAIKDYESTFLNINNIKEIVNLLNDLDIIYKNTSRSKNQISYKIGLKNEIQIEFFRNDLYRRGSGGFYSDEYIILNNTLTWKNYYEKEVWKLKCEENGNIDCTYLKKLLTSKMSNRLRETLYNLK